MDESTSTPDYIAVRGAADWVIYFYGDRAHQGEDDQTAAARWALGDDLADQLIILASKVAKQRVQLAEALALLGESDYAHVSAEDKRRLRAILTRHLES